jgi:hypothetical protein
MFAAMVKHGKCQCEDFAIKREIIRVEPLARHISHDLPARSFICVPPWHGLFDVEIDCVARM